MAGTFFDNIFNSVLAKPVTQDTGLRGDTTVPTILNPSNIGSLAIRNTIENPLFPYQPSQPAALPQATAPTMLTGQNGLLSTPQPRATTGATSATPALVPTEAQNMRAFGLTPEQIQTTRQAAEQAASKNKILTTSASDIASNQKNKYSDIMEKALNYYLGYDTSPEAQRIREIQKQLGKISGAQQSALSQIETTPGLTSFQSGRRQQALAQAAGGVTDPLTAELQALTGQQQAKETSLQNVLALAKQMAPNMIGSPITDDSGNVTVLSQDPTTGAITQQSLGQISAPKAASSDIAEYNFAKQQGFKGSYLEYLRAKTSATTKATGTGAGGIDLTASEKGAVSESNTILKSIDEIKSLGAATNWAGIGGLWQGSIKDFFAKNFGSGSPEEASLRSKIGFLQATIQKAQAGTSFTEGEKQILFQYTPTINDSPLVIEQKLANLQQLQQNKLASIKQTASGKGFTQTSDPIDAYLKALGL